MENYLNQLLYEFHEDEIEWRILEAGEKNNTIWAKACPYVQNRAIMKRLDEVVGQENWKNEFKEWITFDKIKSCMCGISIKIGQEWVTKWDASEIPDVEPIKGVMSHSMKRAAVQWGIGRYLYGFDIFFVETVLAEVKKDNKAAYSQYNKYGQIKRKDNSIIPYYWKCPTIQTKPKKIFRQKEYELSLLNQMENLSGISAEEMIKRLEEKKNNPPHPTNATATHS